VNGRVYLVTGISASGKSTVAQALAERLPRSVHVRGDAFRRAIVNGREQLGPELTVEAAGQLELRYRVAATAARMYCEAGFEVVYQDIILGKSLPTVVGYFDGLPLSVVVLCPDAATVAKREQARGKTAYAGSDEIAFFVP
jgi:chloramphenicol 3-O-phosphotransferase